MLSFNSPIMDAEKEQFCFLIKTQQPDGAGGFHTVWTDGAAFWAVAQQNAAIASKVAEKESNIGTFAFFVPIGTPLGIGDAVRRLSTGKTYQITDAPKEHEPPKFSRIGVALCYAREWVLPL